MRPALARALDELVREEYGSNKALAEHIRVSESTIQRIRHGHIPSLTVLRKFAERTSYNLLELQRLAGMPVDPPVMSGGERSEVEDALVQAASRLTPKNRRIVQRLIDTLLAEQRAEEQDEG